jgi:hypothetical protein
VDPDHSTIEPPDDIPAVSAEELVEGEPTPDRADPDAEHPGPRRYPSTLGGAFYLVVLAAAATGIGMVALEDWRTGIRVVGGALLFAALVRLVLSNEDAGMLAVRRKAIDVPLLILAGALMLALAQAIVDRPGG